MGRMVPNKSEKVVKAYHRPAKIDDVSFVAANMRQEDRDECFALSGTNAVQSLFSSYFISNPCMTIVSRHGQPMGMWGVSRICKTSGRVWMLGCKNMLDDSRDKYEFLRQSRIELKKLHQQFPVLFNYIDARNTVHLRWLKFMGFSIIKKHEKFGYENLPFYEFAKI